MRILYGVTGEGMGHATRSKVTLEHLREAYDQAHPRAEWGSGQ